MIFTDFNILLKKYAWIAAVAIAVIVLIVLIFFLVRNHRKPKKNTTEVDVSVIESLGGIENILSAEAKMSRLNVTLSDYSLVDDERLKELGVSRIIKMTSKVTLLIGEQAKAIEELIKSIKK